LAALRRSVVRGAPLGEDSWRERTAKRLGLTSTLRPRGRPQNRRVGTAHQYLGSDAVPGIWWAVPTLPGCAAMVPLCDGFRESGITRFDGETRKTAGRDDVLGDVDANLCEQD